jgi:leader peptidase (prepilin peptidase)/N-methyltransferase
MFGLVAACGALGVGLGPMLQPVVDRVAAARSESGSVSRRTRLTAPLIAGVFAVMAWQIGWTWQLPAYLALGAFLVVLSLVDLETKTLPRRIVWAAGATGIGLLTMAALATGEPGRIVLAALGAVAALVVLCVLHIAARGAFGFGDVRLGTVLGWYLGYQGLTMVFAGVLGAFILSAAVGVCLLVFGRAGRRTEVPFGPFLALASLLVLLAGAPPA